MKTLITGGAGFIGSHLQDRLIKEGYQVIVLDNLSTGRKENLNKKARFYKIDICSPKIFQIFQREKPEIVFHLAAQVNLRKSIENPIESAKLNILGSLNILESCKKIKIKKIIFASSGGAIYGWAKIIPTSENYLPQPISPYGIEKLATEKYLEYYWHNFKIPYVSLRISNAYGPRQNSKTEGGVIAIFIDRIISQKQPVIFGNGRQTRDFVFVEDVVEANILAMKSKKCGFFNIGTGKETTINTIFSKLKEITSSKCKKIYGPAPIGELKRSCLNWKQAKKELNWEPKYSLDKGLKETIKWFQENVNKRIY